MNFEALNSYLPSARDAVQILFFIVVGTVTVLTYIKAKRTLLQPIRTEIFKEQVKSLTALLGFFTGKSEVDLRETFGFDKLLHANACAMLDAYARMFFDLDIDDAKRPYSRSKCPTSIVSEKHLRLADDHMRLDEEKPPVKPDASVKAALWSEYDHGMIYVPKELTGIEQVLREILDSPLLPSRCVELGEAFLKTVHEDIYLLKKILVEASKELPQKYPNLEVLKVASLGWIHARYTDEFVSLHPKAKALSDFIRKYYLTDKLLDS